MKKEIAGRLGLRSRGHETYTITSCASVCHQGINMEDTGAVRDAKDTGTSIMTIHMALGSTYSSKDRGEDALAATSVWAQEQQICAHAKVSTLANGKWGEIGFTGE